MENSKLRDFIINTPCTTITIYWTCKACATRFNGSILSFIEFITGPNEDKCFNKCYFCNSSERTIASTMIKDKIIIPYIHLQDFVELCRNINPGIPAYQVKNLYSQVCKLYDKQEDIKELRKVLKDVEQW